RRRADCDPRADLPVGRRDRGAQRPARRPPVRAGDAGDARVRRRPLLPLIAELRHLPLQPAGPVPGGAGWGGLRRPRGGAALRARPPGAREQRGQARTGSHRRRRMTQRAWLKRLRPVLSTLLSAAIVGAIFFYFLPKFTDMSSVWTAIKDLTPVEMTVL